MKNHNLSLTLDNHCQIAEHLINQSNQLCLQSQACQLFCSISLSLLCSVFLIQFSLTQIFLLIFLLLFYLTDLILMFEILIKSIIRNNYFALCHAFLKKSFICLFFSSHFVFLFEISVKLFATSHYSISCSIFKKDLCLHS